MRPNKKHCDHCNLSFTTLIDTQEYCSLCGYFVYRNISPNGPCDIISLKDGITKKVEVTTGRLCVNGKISYPSKNPKYDFDILAVVLPNLTIIYYEKTNNGNMIEFDRTILAP